MSKVTPSPGYSARIPYLLFMFAGIIIALCLRQWGGETLYQFYTYSFALCTEAECAGNQAVFRVSFALTIFFFTMFLVTVLPCSGEFSGGLWALKALYYAGILVAVFYIPNDFFTGYANVSRFGSAVFLFLQLISLVDFAYRWNESWVDAEYYREVCGASLCFIFSYLTAWILLFLYYANGEECGLQRTFISLTIFFTLSSTLLAISGWIDHGAILPSAVIGFYATYLLYNALRSDTSSCNPENKTGSTGTQIVLGVLFAALSITYTSWSLSRNQKHLFSNEDEHEKVDVEMASRKSAEQTPNVGTEQAKADIEHDKEKVENDPEVRKTNAFFHFVMFMASMYMGMLLTGWAVNLDNSSDIIVLGRTNMWVNMVSQWTVFALYLWTLLAVKCCPSREFG